MNAIQGLILGIVQGLTEFLPISSSGHLLVLQKIFGIDTDGQLLLNILLHLGTLVAVFAVYWRASGTCSCTPYSPDLKWLVVATIPAVIAALVVDFDAAFEGQFIIWSFYLTSIVLVAGDVIGKWRRRNHRVHKRVGVKDALTMGVHAGGGHSAGPFPLGSTISAGVASGPYAQAGGGTFPFSCPSPPSSARWCWS